MFITRLSEAFGSLNIIYFRETNIAYTCSYTAFANINVVGNYPEEVLIAVEVSEQDL